MGSNSHRTRWRSARGQALAEFVVVVPLLLLLLMAIVGFGHLIFTEMVVVQAANRAARLGAVLFGDSTVPESEARKETREAALATLSTALNGTDREVVISEVGDDLRVTVRYRSTVFVPLLKPWLGSEYSVEHQAVYRVERDTP